MFVGNLCFVSISPYHVFLITYSIYYPLSLCTHINSSHIEERHSEEFEGLLPDLPAELTNLPTPHVILLMGPPTSGRSEFSQHRFPNHVQINSEKGQKRTPLQEFKEFIAAGKNVIVDRTHGCQRNRKKVVDACKTLKVPVYAVWVTAPLRASMAVRIVYNHSSRGTIKYMTRHAYTNYAREFQAPSLSEGFNSITTIPWYVFFRTHTVFSYFTITTFTTLDFPTSFRIPRIPRLPSGEFPLQDLDSRVCNEQRIPPHQVPQGKSPISLNHWTQDPKRCPNAIGMGAVSRSRNYADYFFQRVRVIACELPEYQ